MLALALALLLAACTEARAPTWQSLGLSGGVLAYQGNGARSDEVLSERISFCTEGRAELYRVNRRTIMVEHPITWTVNGQILELRDKHGRLDRLRIVARSTSNGLGTVVVQNSRGDVLTYVRLATPAACR